MMRRPVAPRGRRAASRARRRAVSAAFFASNSPPARPAGRPGPRAGDRRVAVLAHDEPLGARARTRNERREAVRHLAQEEAALVAGDIPGPGRVRAGKPPLPSCSGRRAGPSFRAARIAASAAAVPRAMLPCQSTNSASAGAPAATRTTCRSAVASAMAKRATAAAGASVRQQRRPLAGNPRVDMSSTSMRRLICLKMAAPLP